MIGSLLFVRTSSPISWLIRRVTNSQFSHVCISVSKDDDWIIEADILKRISPRKNPYKNFVVVDLGLSCEQRLRLVSYLLKQSGLRYDYKYVFGYLLRYMGFIKNESKFDTYGRYMCSELIDKGLASIGIDLFKDKRDGNCTPADLARLFDV